jgi:hypothetical protein
VYKAFSTAATTPKQRCDTLRWLLYGFVAAAGSADDTQQQQQQLLTWQGVWSDALSNILGLAAQLALNPEFGGVGLTYLMQEVVPAEFADLAGQAAAAAGLSEDSSSSLVSRAAGVDVVQPVGQLQVQRQLLALTFWQHYAAVEGRYLAWKQARISLLTGNPEARVPLDESLVLVQDMLQLVQADLLRLPGSRDLAELLSSMKQPTAAAGGTTATTAAAIAGINENTWLCEPLYDPPVDPLLLAAYAEGSVEQVLGLVPFSELQLAVTVSRHQLGLSHAAADTQDLDAQYSRLQVRRGVLMVAAAQIGGHVCEAMSGMTKASLIGSASRHLPAARPYIWSCVVCMY